MRTAGPAPAVVANTDHRRRLAIPETQLNIGFLSSDNFAWGDLGCYGDGVLRGAPRPQIDGLAAEGLKLLNFGVEAPCTPARSSLLTGRHPAVFARRLNGVGLLLPPTAR